MNFYVVRLLASLILLQLSACGPSAEEIQQQNRLEEMQKSAAQYFGNKVEAGTFGVWTVAAISKKSFGKANIIEVTLDLPTDQAEDIMSRTSPGQFKAVGLNACPRSNSTIWAPFKKGDILYIQARYEGHVFIDVDCTRWRL